MDAAHIHLLLNHVPVLGAIFGFLLLAFATWKGKDESTKVSLGVFALVGLAAVVVYLTGEPAEELVEGLPGFSEANLERHEEAALIATIGAGIVGLFAIGGLWLYRRRRVAVWFRTLSLVLGLGVVGLMGWTANLGGQVMHAEIRPDGAVTSQIHEEDSVGSRAARALPHQVAAAPDGRVVRPSTTSTSTGLFPPASPA